jgi:acyl-CoA hydrolase
MGSLPEGVLARLGHLRHLGLHTGIFTDGMQALMESGVVDNSTKRFKPGVSMSTMAGGSADLYRYMHRNPAVEMHPCDITHGPQVLAQMDGFCAINSALQVDLAGCVNAEWVGCHAGQKGVGHHRDALCVWARPTQQHRGAMDRAWPTHAAWGWLPLLGH